MSYSFSVKAPSAGALATAIGQQFDAIIASQPVHAADRDQVVAAVQALAGVMRAPTDSEDIGATVYGSVSSDPTQTPPTIEAVSVNISLGFTPKA